VYSDIGFNTLLLEPSTQENKILYLIVTISGVIVKLVKESQYHSGILNTYTHVVAPVYDDCFPLPIYSKSTSVIFGLDVIHFTNSYPLSIHN
jgi:hypothetical protein